MLPASHLTPIVLGVCVSVGAKVTLLEKEAKVGGNSAKATSGINGWGTMPQAVEQIHDEERHFERDTFRSGKGGTALAHASLTSSIRTAQSQASAWVPLQLTGPVIIVSPTRE